MKRPLVLPLPGNEDLAAQLAKHLDGDLGELETRKFPDDETYVRMLTDLRGRDVVLVCTLERPDPKFLPLTFVAITAQHLGALRVGLVAPYLAYMRQDRRFHEGEAVSSKIFATSLSSTFDWIVTVDPHLHRYNSLDEIYTIPTRVVHSAPLLADWIAANEPTPLVIGPDIESEQRVSEVATQVNAPYRILRKKRRGDRNVEIAVPDLHEMRERKPVLVDDIVSSGKTMTETALQLRALGMLPPVCIAVHALLSPDAFAALREAAGAVVSTNCVPHESNRIDVSGLLADGVTALLGANP